MLADHISHQPVEDYLPLKFNFPNEDIMAIKDYEILGDDEGPKLGEQWTLIYDTASNAMGHGIRAILISPKNYHLPLTSKLYFDCTNNIVEYKACILGLEETIDFRIKILEVNGDSTLMIHPIKGDSEPRHPNLIPYMDYMLKLL